MTGTKTAADWIKQLGLQRHPEGGWYRELFRSSLLFPATVLPREYQGDRPAYTSIYYLLEAGDFSAWHRIVSDEVWYFHAGDPLEVISMSEAGEVNIHRLGDDILQCCIPGGHWFGARPAAGAAFALVGCLVAPGFDFADFVMGDRETLLQRFPAQAALIASLSR